MENFETRYRQGKGLIDEILEQYQEKACQCAYPRFRQIVSIDCARTGDSFTCYDTEIFIDAAKKYFEITESELSDENSNERWVCKTCGSVYEYGWSDFSIHVARQKLVLTKLNTKDIGPEAKKPIPLFVGVMGHSCPPKSEIIDVGYEEFKKYIQI